MGVLQKIGKFAGNTFAIGYRKFNVMSGMKKLVSLKTSDGGYVPFGTEVTNELGRSAGLVDENGLVYLSGIQINQKMVAQLGDGRKCFITLSEQDLKADDGQSVVCN